MNTLNREQIDQLERLLKHPHPCPGDRELYSHARQSLLWLKLLVIATMAMASMACFNPNTYTFSTSALMVVVLLIFNFSIAVKNRSQLKLDRHNKLNSVAIGVGVLGMLGVILTGIQPVMKNSAAPFIPDMGDTNLGRTVVGGKLPGMSLKKSQLTGHVDTNSLTSALYWTMDFANSSSQPQEARARIALPEGAAVSRVTLWINGIEQEAAFNSSTRTQAAYQWIVNTGRDPLLLTETRKGEVFLQAFPVPQNGEMKVRFGITSPLTIKTRRDFSLVPPRIVEANFESEKLESKLKLESDAPIESNDGQQVSEDDAGNFVLSGTLKGDAPFSIHRQNNFTTFASRATHSADHSYITERLEQNWNGIKPIFEKTQTLPQSLIAYDFPTASRMSTLWAAEEARKCVALNEWETAAQLGTAYRVVTPASGAVVLESQYDYDYTGLKRNFYSVVPATAKAGNNHASTAKSADAAFAPDMQRSDKGIIDPHTMNWQSELPSLQGATNGTIGPQGADATMVIGVNTSGTVRVNNLANLEALLTLIANAFQIGALICGAILLVNGLFKAMPYYRAANRLLVGSSLVIIGFLSPGVISYVIASIRDANLIG